MCKMLIINHVPGKFVTTENILRALDEKRKWERRLEEMEDELEELREKRKEVMSELGKIRDLRKKLYDQLCNHYVEDGETNVYKTQGETPRVIVR